LLASPIVPMPSRHDQTAATHRPTVARSALLSEFGFRRITDIVQGRPDAPDWERDGRILSVEWHGERVYPAFQFAGDNTPHPAVADVLAALPRDKMTEWEVALWWTAANGWLGYERPVDLLLEGDADDANRLVEAAAHLAAPSPL